jgi:hypothetical protein
MSESNKQMPTLQEIRQQARREVIIEKPDLEPHEKDLEIMHRVFERIDPEQITIEIATEFLQAEEKYWREETDRSLKDSSAGAKSNTFFNIWSDADDALRGAQGKHSYADTINYFRTRSEELQKRIDKLEKIINGELPLQEVRDNKYLFDLINNLEISRRAIEHEMNNYNVVVNLFRMQSNSKIKDYV